MITATIKEGCYDALQSLLASMNQAPGFADPHNALVPWQQFKQVHVARFVVLDAKTDDDIKTYNVEPTEWPATLCLMGDIDGSVDLFLAELVIRAEPGLRTIFSHCQSFRNDHTDLLSWLQQQRQSPAANYINWRGRTVTQINEEAALHRSLKIRLHELQQQSASLTADLIYQQLQQFVKQQVAEGQLPLTEDSPTPPGWWIKNTLHLIGVPLILLGMLPFMLIVAPIYLFALRRLETTDAENTLRAERSHLQALAVQEDIDVTNQFNVFGQVKPGLLRLITIRLGLLLLDYSSRHIYKRGFLTRIQTIHFARWVLLDNSRRVYFASNYDGSADSYMDDFINKVAWGLNLVFSNGVGYPRTRWLIKGGAQSETNYQRTLRRNQLPSGSWYKAFPGLTAVDMARNHRIRKGLDKPLTSTADIQNWLQLL
jgi:hypothetical protein